MTAIETTATADIGVVGLAVMGSNLARNLASHGHAVAVYNRTFARTESMMADHGDEGNFVPSEDIKDFRSENAANEWIAAQAPWNIAKDPARDAELHAVATLAINALGEHPSKL